MNTHVQSTAEAATRIPSLSNFDWDAAKKTIKSAVGQEVYSVWLESLRFERLEGDAMHLSVRNATTKDWIVRHYADKILKALSREYGHIGTLEISARDGPFIRKGKPEPKPVAISRKLDAGLPRGVKAPEPPAITTRELDQWEYIPAGVLPELVALVMHIPDFTPAMLGQPDGPLTTVDPFLFLDGAMPRVPIENIQRLVALHYKVPKNELLTNRRTRTIVKPRQVAMYLAKIMTPRSLPEIGRRFGGRDHTTVLHAVRKIEDLSSRDKVFARELEYLRKKIWEELRPARVTVANQDETKRLFNEVKLFIMGEFLVSIEDLESAKNASLYVAKVVQIAIALAKILSGLPNKELGEYFGLRPHLSVDAGLRVIEVEMRRNPIFARYFENCQSRIKKGHDLRLQAKAETALPLAQ